MFIISTAAPVLTQPTISVTNVTTVSAQINLLTAATGATPITYFLTVTANPAAPLPSSVTYFVAAFPYTVTALIPGTPYGFSLEATDIAMNIYRSPASVLQQITTGSTATAPGQVTGLTANAVSSSQINLVWSAASGASTYTVKRNGTVVYSGLTATTLSDPALPPSTLETYQVAGVNSSGIGAYSVAVSATTQNVLISASGTTIAPATQIVDASLNVWTVAGGQIYLNGVVQAITNNVILLLYYGGVIYQENSSDNWYIWSGTAWSASGGDPRVAQPPPIGNFGIAVSGNKLINTANGAQAILQGGNISGLESSNPIANSYNIIAGITPAQWVTIMTTWGINVFRFPTNSAYIINHTVHDDPAVPGYAARSYTSIGGGAYTPDPTGGYMAAIKQIAQNIGTAGGYADFDLHWDAPKSSAGNPIAPIGQPGLPSDYAAQALAILAAALAGMPWAIIELFNEPFGNNVFGQSVNTGTNPYSPGTYAKLQMTGGSMTGFVTQQNPSNAIVTLNGGASCTVASMQSLTTAIRNAGFTGVILGPGPWYSGNVECWSAMYQQSGNGGPIADPAKNFAAAWHDYKYSYGTAGPLSVLSGGNPIVMTETAGFDSALDGGTSANGYTWAASQGIGVILWSWATWASGSANSSNAMFNYLNTTSPWTNITGATGKPAPTGNRFTQGPYVQAASGAPAPAAAVGFNTKTFDSTTVGTSTGQWNFWTGYPYGSTPPSSAAVQNSDGSVTMSGNYNSGATLVSAWNCNGGAGNPFKGVAFSGGFFWQSTVSISNPTGSVGSPWALWMMDIDHFCAGNSAVGVNGSVQWPNTPGSIVNYFLEIDVAEGDFSAVVGTKVGYQVNQSNWISYTGGNVSWGPSNNWPTAYSGGSGSITVPPATDLTQKHTISVLKVPATGSGQSTTTQGYMVFYFDGVQVAGGLPSGLTPTRACYWGYHDPTQPSTYATPTAAGVPLAGTNVTNPPNSNGTYFDYCLSVMDWRHMVLFIGAGSNQNLQVYSSQVWQASAAKNLSY